MPVRRFPPPWTVEELDACFVVTDSAGQKLAYVYFKDEPRRRSAVPRREGARRDDPLGDGFTGLCVPMAKSTS
jgi:hypothetical protein